MSTHTRLERTPTPSVDPRIPHYREAADAIADGCFAIRIPVEPPDEIGKLGEALLKLADAMERKVQEFSNLLSIATKVNAGILLEDVLDCVYELFRQLLPYDRIGFSLIEADRRTLRAVWFRTEACHPGIENNYTAPLAGSSLEEIIRSGKPRILNDLPAYLEAHPQSDATRRIVAEGIRSSLTCPLIAMNKPIGFIFFSSAQPQAYGEQHVTIFSHIAGQLATIVEKARLYEDLVNTRRLLEESNLALSRLSTQDALTGLPNRQQFDDDFFSEWRRMLRVGAHLGLIMVDVDHFKKVNDQHGHLAGDECLKLVAQALRKALPRQTDIVARYGGEEFALVLPATNAEGARHVAELLQQRLAAMRAESPEHSPTRNLTLSMGVTAARPTQADKPLDLLRLADAALYEAKQAGRNCVRVRLNG